MYVYLFINFEYNSVVLNIRVRLYNSILVGWVDPNDTKEGGGGGVALEELT